MEQELAIRSANSVIERYKNYIGLSYGDRKIVDFIKVGSAHLLIVECNKCGRKAKIDKCDFDKNLIRNCICSRVKYKLTNKTIGRWTILEKANRSDYLCKCECGTTLKINAYSLVNNKRVHCRKCQSIEKCKSLIGKKFGDWSVIDHCYDEKLHLRVLKCQCKCGFIKNQRLWDLQNRKSNQCQQCYNRINLESGERFGRLTVIEFNSLDKNRKARWKCLCDCGNYTISYGSDLVREKSTQCLQCRYKEQNTGYGEISGSFFSVIKLGAKKRNLEFNITIEEVWDLFIKQNRKCAYTNIELIMDGSIERTASLDRKNNNKGYTLDNIHWVHKDVNFMKQDYSHERFIEICKLVAKKYE